MPGAAANVLFIALCTVSAFLVFDRERKNKFQWQFGIKTMFRLLTFLSLAVALITQLPMLDQFAFPRIGLTRSYGVSGLPHKVFLLVGVACFLLLIADSLLFSCNLFFNRPATAASENLENLDS